MTRQYVRLNQGRDQTKKPAAMTAKKHGSLCETNTQSRMSIRSLRELCLASDAYCSGAGGGARAVHMLHMRCIAALLALLWAAGGDVTARWKFHYFPYWLGEYFFAYGRLFLFLASPSFFLFSFSISFLSLRPEITVLLTWRKKLLTSREKKRSKKEKK